MSLAASSLILDLDGTLIDSRPGILESFGRAVEAVFPGREFNLAGVVLGPPIQRMFEVSFPGVSEREIGELLRAFRGHYDREGSLQTLVYDGALDVLAQCQRRGIAVDIATNKPLRISTFILGHFKLEHYFRSVVAADSKQPPFGSKAEIVGHLLRANDLKAGETLYVGDSAEDAAAAAACGIRFVWAAYGYGTLGEEEGRTVFRTIRRLGDLTGLLG